MAKYRDINIDYRGPSLRLPDMRAGTINSLSQLINTKLKINQMKDVRFQSSVGYFDKTINYNWESEEAAKQADVIAKNRNVTGERLSGQEIGTSSGYQSFVSDIVAMKNDPEWKKLITTDAAFKQYNKILPLVQEKIPTDYYNLLLAKIEDAKANPLDVDKAMAINPYSFIPSDIGGDLLKQKYSGREELEFAYDPENKRTVIYKSKNYDPSYVSEVVSKILRSPGHENTIKLNMELEKYKDVDGNAITDMENGWDDIVRYYVNNGVVLDESKTVVKYDRLNESDKLRADQWERNFKYTQEQSTISNEMKQSYLDMSEEKWAIQKKYLDPELKAKIELTRAQINKLNTPTSSGAGSDKPFKNYNPWVQPFFDRLRDLNVLSISGNNIKVNPEHITTLSDRFYLAPSAKHRYMIGVIARNQQTVPYPKIKYSNLSANDLSDTFKADPTNTVTYATWYGANGELNRALFSDNSSDTFKLILSKFNKYKNQYNAGGYGSTVDIIKVDWKKANGKSTENPDLVRTGEIFIKYNFINKKGESDQMSFPLITVTKKQRINKSNDTYRSTYQMNFSLGFSG